VRISIIKAKVKEMRRTSGIRRAHDLEHGDICRDILQMKCFFGGTTKLNVTVMNDSHLQNDGG
jgi:hypothetical protein